MVSEQFDSGDNMLPLEADRVHSETEDEDLSVKKLVEKDLTTGEMAIQLVISEKAGDERSCEEDAQGGDPALLQKTQSAVKKGKIRKKKKRWKTSLEMQGSLEKSFVNVKGHKTRDCDGLLLGFVDSKRRARHQLKEGKETEA
ncbi:hypothetical protein Bca52824_074811 [Brassica carinata]|uniref:Uncharacterized protein n=2 Tax=Brassica TaxID=3705 RepID=A0A8X7PQY0_BRACI|nr:hypothetical protein Bca52824_074811 [Brassica carinata]